MVRIISLFAIFLLSFTANAQDIYNIITTYVHVDVVMGSDRRPPQ